MRAKFSKLARMVEKPAPDRVRIPRESLPAWSRLHREMKRRLAATDADYRKYAGEPSDGEILHRLIELGCQVYGVDPPVPYDAPFYEAPPREMVDIDRLLGPLRIELERMLEEIDERARLSAPHSPPGFEFGRSQEAATEGHSPPGFELGRS